MGKKIVEAKTNKKGHEIEPIFGVPIFGGRKREALKILTDKMDKKAIRRPLFVITLNTEMLMISQKDEEFGKILKQADLLVPDSAGLRWLGCKNIYPGRSLVKDLLDMGKYRVYFLGWKKDLGWERRGVSGAKTMAGKYGGRWEAKDFEDDNLAKINKYKPDLLLVAFGAPMQEKWIHRNKDRLKAKVVMGVGGAFDYLTGERPLPPGWVEKMGLEWLWRLFGQPWRIKRQMRLIKFVLKIIRTKLF